MNFVDTHCHLYSEEFNDDRDAMILRAKAAGAIKLYMPNIDMDSIEGMLALEQQYPGLCVPMMGLHPCYVKDDYLNVLEKIEHWLTRRPFVAVGEIGLDFYWDTRFVNQQYQAFRLQIEWALQYNYPIVIHTRNAMRECIDVVKEYADRGIRGIFHCFGGTPEEAREIVDMGFYLGIGGVLTYKKANLPQILSHIDLKHIVLETDAPYLSPVPKRGKRNESAYIPYIIDALATVKNCSPQEIADITTANASFVFENRS